MYCTVCGNQNPDDARFCTACGNPQQTETASRGASQASPSASGNPTGQQFTPPFSPLPQGNIPNYLPQAILVTICCCLPAGIVSIVFAAQVNGKIARGDLIGARSSSNNAKTWAWVAFGLGIASGIIFAISSAAGL